jgi:hypothetical protein
MAAIKMGEGPLVGWSLLRIEGERAERTLRHLILKLVNHTTMGDGPKALRLELPKHGRTYGELVRDSLLELEGVTILAECKRLALQTGLKSLDDKALMAAAHAIILAVDTYRVLAAPKFQVLVDPDPPTAGEDTPTTSAPPPGAGPQPAAPVGSKDVAGAGSSDSGDQKNWGKAEWDVYLEVDVPQELVKFLYMACLERDEAKEELVDNVAMAERNGELAELAEAKRKGQNKIALKLRAWQRVCTKVEAVALELLDPKQKPWKWPCTGLQLASTTAKVKRAKDAIRLEASKASE